MMSKQSNKGNVRALSTAMIILASVIVISILLLTVKVSPLTAFGALISGAFGSKLGIINTIVKASPICLCALAVAVAKQAGIFNIGVNGQMTIGALATAVVGVYLKGVPAIIHIPLCLLAGMLGGMLYASIPAIAYIKKKITLIVIFLLMNTMANLIVTWLIFVYLKDPNSMATATYRIQRSAQLPNLMVSPTRLSIAFIITLVVCVIIYLFFYKTTAGYELRVTGLNRQAAIYSGINVNKYLGSSLIIGGALGGLAGGLEILGLYYRMYNGELPSYGFDGIPIAILANNNPIGIIIGSIIFGAIRVGSSTLQVKTGVTSKLVDVIQGVLICFIALEYLFQFFSGKIIEKIGKIMKKEAVK